MIEHYVSLKYWNWRAGNSSVIAIAGIFFSEHWKYKKINISNSTKCNNTIKFGTESPSKAVAFWSVGNKSRHGWLSTHRECPIRQLSHRVWLRCCLHSESWRACARQRCSFDPDVPCRGLLGQPERESVPLLDESSKQVINTLGCVMVHFSNGNEL